MRLPAGTVEGIITNPKKEGLLQYLMTFKGLIETETPSGHGFILINNGTLVSAYFKNAGALFRGQSALAPMNMESDTEFESPQTLNVRKYTDDEYSRAVQISLEEGLIIHEPGAPAGGGNEDLFTDEAAVPPEPLDETKLKKIKGLAGVIAVAAFYEGFAIQSLGDADFEHVAASAEDLMRAGTKIARDMKIGALDQMILETDENKFIIAPCGDLYICVFTTADAHLGLIRVVLKNIQSEISG
jgi:predicted regulator of Ras-like GTPase activity (Roadblock/LC7/MglB family)